MVDRLLDGRQFREQDPGAVRAVEADHLEVLGDPAATGLGHLDDQPGVGVVVGKDAVDFGVFVKEAGENGLFFLHRGVVINLVGNGGVTGLAHQILYWQKTPEKIYDMAYDYMFAVLLGTGATIFYNMISNILRALGDSRTPLVFLVFSSLLNIVLDVVFIVPFKMGVAGAAWATVLSPLLSAILCTVIGVRKFLILRLKKEDFQNLGSVIKTHMSMGFQMSVMCIGQLAMQGAVNALGTEAIAGYTAATKVDQFSVLMNAAFGIAISNYVAQNYGAGLWDRIRKGTAACLLQTSIANALMCVMIIFGRHLVVPMFVTQPTAEIIWYSDYYLMTVAPFYLLLGVLQIYRSAIQSMGNSWTPFTACIIELIFRITSTTVFAGIIGYVGICFATPFAWIGAIALLVPVYWHEILKRRKK